MCINAHMPYYTYVHFNGCVYTLFIHPTSIDRRSGMHTVHITSLEFVFENGSRWGCGFWWWLGSSIDVGGSQGFIGPQTFALENSHCWAPTGARVWRCPRSHPKHGLGWLVFFVRGKRLGSICLGNQLFLRVRCQFSIVNT